MLIVEKVTDYNYTLMFDEYQESATRGDYDNLLQVSMKFCEVRWETSGTLNLK